MGKKRSQGGGMEDDSQSTNDEEVAEEDAGFDVRQLCVRKHEAEERDEPLMLFSSSPEVGVLEPLLDLVQEVPARGAVRNMIAGRGSTSNHVTSSRLCSVQSGVGQRCELYRSSCARRGSPSLL